MDSWQFKIKLRNQLSSINST